MAWQFYDSFNSPEAQGPMPCKRWVKRPDDPKYKLRKWRPEGKHSHVSFFGGYQKSTTPIRETQEYMAREYARWLAARDKIELPIEGTIQFSWIGDRIAAVFFRDVTVRIPNWDFNHSPMEQCGPFID